MPAIIVINKYVPPTAAMASRLTPVKGKESNMDNSTLRDTAVVAGTAASPDEDEIEIDLGALFKALLNGLWIIVISVLILGIVFFAYANYFVTPLYESSVSMLGFNKTEANSTVSSSDYTASVNLLDTYAALIESNTILNEVISISGVDYTTEELDKMIDVTTDSSTLILYVTVTSDDPDEAALIADTVLAVAPDLIVSMVEGTSISAVDSAVVADEPSSPNVLKYTLIGAVIGLFVSCAIIVVRELVFSNRTTVEERVRKEFNLSVLSVIPELDHSGKKSNKNKQKTDLGALCDKLDFASLEAYKLLRTNLAFCISGDRKCRVIGVTSSVRGEGKSTTAINLAYTFSQTGAKVCLVDCDMRLPTDASKLKLKGRPGLSNLVSGQTNSADVLLQKFRTKRGSFHVLAAGDVPPNPAELLGSTHMETVVKTLSNSFDYIVLDLPPVTAVSDPLIAARLVQGLLLVVREDIYEKKILTDAVSQLLNVKANILGVVVTHSSQQQKEYKRYGGKYGYGYGYGYGNTETAEHHSSQAPAAAAASNGAAVPGKGVPPVADYDTSTVMSDKRNLVREDG